MGALNKEADLQNPVFYFNLCTFITKINIFLDLPTLFFDLRYLNTTTFWGGLETLQSVCFNYMYRT